jgi:hypothetical protein
VSAEKFDSLDPADPIEARLHAMRPAELPPALARSLDRAKPRRIRWLAFAAPLAAAAAWVIAFFFWPNANTEPQAATDSTNVLQPSDLRIFVPVEERSTLVEVHDLGLVETMPARPVRLMRYTWIDDTTLRADDGRSTMHRTEPREQIVPVVLPVF